MSERVKGFGDVTVRQRVLIVEDDPELAMRTLDACIEAGLEPKLCMGPARSGPCPGLKGEHCPRTEGIAATFVAISSGSQRIAAPACAAGRLAIAGERPLLGVATVGVLNPDQTFGYPYDPRDVASALAALATDEGPSTGAERR